MDTVEEPQLKVLKQKNEPKMKTFRDNLSIIKDNITVEPVLIFYVIPGALAKLGTQYLNLDKACRVSIEYSDKVCDALVAKDTDKYAKEELAVQQLIAGMETWKNLLLTAIPCLLIIFLGSWSDRTGKRKLCIILPIIGELLMCLSNIVNTYFFYKLPVEVAIFFQAFFPAITGAWITTYMGAFAYISDVSNEESRTFRIGIAVLCATTGEPIGSALSGILLKKIGYYGIFILSSAMYLFSIFYGFMYIKNPKRPSTNRIQQYHWTNITSFLKSFFDLKHVKDTMTAAFKKGPNHRKIKSILVLTSFLFSYGPIYVSRCFATVEAIRNTYLKVPFYDPVNIKFTREGTVFYLFTRYRFNWDAVQYSIYNTVFLCMLSVGSLFSISVFNRRLKWDDSVLGIISSFSKIFGAMTSGLARSTADMYIVVPIQMFHAVILIVLRSISSKLVASDELGKMTSMLCLMETLASMIFGPLYSWIYMITLQIDVGIIYYVSTALTVLPLLSFGWFFLQHKKSESLARQVKRENSAPITDSELRKDEETVSCIPHEDEMCSNTFIKEIL